VTNDPSLATGKIRNARRHGVPIVDEAAFTDLLKDVAAGAAKPGPRDSASSRYTSTHRAISFDTASGRGNRTR
jgi:hypothetical protein